MKQFTSEIMKGAAAILALTAATASAASLQKAPLNVDKDMVLPGIEMRNLISGMKGKKAADNPARMESNLEVLLEEDFSGFIPELSDSVNVTSGVAVGDPFINPTYFNGQEGWWGQGVYSAGGAAGLVAPGIGGTISTPNMTLYGNIHISCKVKVQEGNNSNLILFLAVGHGMDRQPALVGYDMKTFAKNDWEQGWIEVEATIPSTYDGDDAWVQLNGMNYHKTGLLVDDLKVSRDTDIVGIPRDVWTYDYTRDGFSATWVPGAENKSYLVNLKGYKQTSDKEEWHYGDFTSDNVPEGWTMTNTEFTALEDGSRGIVMGQGSMVELPSNYATILDFITNVSVDKANPESTLAFAIEGLFDGRWTNLGYTYVYQMEEGQKYEINLAEQVSWFADNFNQVRFTVTDLGYGSEENTDDTKVIVSDLKWSTNGWYNEFTVADRANVSDNHVTFANMDMDALYFLSVAGINGQLVSNFTKEVQAIGVAAPVVLPATDINFAKGTYTANWEAEKHADYGYTVSNFMARTVEEDNPEYIVIADTFADAEGDNAENVMNMSGNFDGLTDVPGWSTAEGGYGITNDNMIGTWYGGVLKSPYLTLNNNGGEYTVYFRLMGYGKAELVVQNGIEYQKARLNGEFDMLTGTYDQDEIEVFMTFKNGRAHDRLEFYTLDGSEFLIGDFQVIQGVKKGDVVYEHESSESVPEGVTSYTFEGLEEPVGFTYSYSVQAHRFVTVDIWTGQDVTTDSNMSADMSVDSATEVRTIGESAGIDRYMPYEVYSTEGVKVSDNVNDLPQGIYILRQGTKATKAVINK